MTTVKLMGGLGNQLFQFAFGKALKKNTGIVQYDTLWYRKTYRRHRPYLLDKFKIDIVARPMYDIRDINVREVMHVYNENFLKVGEGHYFDGYWQHLEYFQDLIPELQKEVVLKGEHYTEDFLWALDEIENDPTSVSLHVRRGDYLQQKDWGVLPNRYYYLALKQAKGNLYVFSDDIEYCKPLFDEKYFANRKVKFINMSQVLDFELMKACRKHVVANSTFSYWAALMDAKPDKVVFCPEYWLGEEQPDLDGDHYPIEWIKIKM
jgi:hypothetical protein